MDDNPDDVEPGSPDSHAEEEQATPEANQIKDIDSEQPALIRDEELNLPEQVDSGAELEKHHEGQGNVEANQIDHGESGNYPKPKASQLFKTAVEADDQRENDEDETLLDEEKDMNKEVGGDDEVSDSRTQEEEEAVLSRELMELNPVYLPKDYEYMIKNLDPSNFARSYRENNPKEARLLDYCENFRRQYAHLCPDRTRLFLAPLNECNVEKFVCTTLRPTHLSFPELYTWDGAANFVADYLEFMPLVPSTELPKYLLSPSTIMELQKGNSFDYAFLLCSLLLGVGYDAYVVSGYATRECCYMDETREACPYLTETKPKPVREPDEEVKKYMVRPPRDLTSKFERFKATRELQAELEQERLAKEEAEQAEEELNKPPPDALYGLRVHAWVLVLAGKREVPESFFIEPLTGLAQALNSSMYLGIESVWNAENYWVNMQDCSNGIADMSYDLTDGSCWEYMLPSGSVKINYDPLEREYAAGLQNGIVDLTNAKIKVQSTLNYELASQESNQSLLIPKTRPEQQPNSARHGSVSASAGAAATHGQPNSKKDSFFIHAGDKKDSVDTRPIASLEDKLLLIDLPPSWTSPIVLDQESYELRYPNGKKTKLYKYCRVEKFAPHSEPDGLILRITIHKDRELMEPIEIRQTYAHRADKLMERTNMVQTNWVVEKFDHGRPVNHLAEHGYYKTSPGPSGTRYMIFYPAARVDGLQKREQTPTTMKEYYVDREDRMYYREVQFGGKIKKFGPSTKEVDGTSHVCMTTTVQLAIDKITERFARNPDVDADEDVAERVFHIVDERIYLTYHIGDERIVPCSREFIKPPIPEDRRSTIQLYNDTHSTFQVNLYAKPKTQVEIYNMLLDLLDEEEKSKKAVRNSETEVRLILEERNTEESNVTLNIDLFDTVRNTEAHELRLALEQAAEEEVHRCKEAELDYLAPFLAQLEIVNGKLTREQAFALREECLHDFKQRLISKANIIQARFEKETENLQKKQQWYQLNQINLSKEDEQDYLQYCNDTTFRITTLEVMLNRHKQTAPQRYIALEKKLRLDPRLSEFLQAG